MLARHGAELKGLQSYLNDDAPQIVAVEAQMAGIREQLDTERRDSVTNATGESLNVIAGQYQELLAELEFMSDAYKSALAGLEAARIESTRKLKSLVLSRISDATGICGLPAQNLLIDGTTYGTYVALRNRAIGRSHCRGSYGMKFWPTLIRGFGLRWPSPHCF